MTEMCYVGCTSINPPYRSQDAGFFLSQLDGKWWLRIGYLTTPEDYFYNDNFSMFSCDSPIAVDLGVSSTFPTLTPSQSCPNAPTQRMIVDQRGHVCTKNDRVVVRTGPSRSYNEVIRLDPGSTFTVIGGPSCANDWSWWEIRTDDNITGWIAEGGDAIDPYFICP